MKYIVRLMAAIPMLGNGIAMIVFCVMAFGSAMYILAAIAAFFGFMVCATHYEDTVKSVSTFLKLMAEDALNE